MVEKVATGKLTLKPQHSYRCCKDVPLRTYSTYSSNEDAHWSNELEEELGSSENIAHLGCYQHHCQF